MMLRYFTAKTMLLRCSKPGGGKGAFGWKNGSGCGLSIGDTSPTLQTEKVPAVWPA